MSTAEITNEETRKIANILGEKWSEMAGDNGRLRAENQALNHALDIMTADRDYWRLRGEAGERERDEERDRSEFMTRQWQGVQAIAKETLAHERHIKPRPALVSDEHTKIIGAKFGADSRQ